MSVRSNVLVLGLIAGALSLSACGKDSCKTPNAPPSYANDGVASIVKDNCLQCHTSKGVPKQAVPDGSYYNTYAGIASVAETAATRTAAGEMPPAGETPLSAADKEKFVQWAVCGAKP